MKKKSIHRKFRRSLDVLVGITVVLFISLTALSIAIYREIELQNPAIPQTNITKSIHQVIDSIKLKHISPLRLFGFNGDFPSVNLLLSNEDMLEFEQAILRSQIDPSYSFKEAKVKGQLQIDDRELEVRVQLKGDRSVHWQNRVRRSYKIKLDEFEAIESLSEFSVQHAVHRNFIQEWLFHQFLAYEDLLHLKYNLINFRINGVGRSTYVQEQAINNLVPEQSNRREGPILRLNEDTYMGEISGKILKLMHSIANTGKKEPSAFSQSTQKDDVV